MLKEIEIINIYTLLYYGYPIGKSQTKYYSMRGIPVYSGEKKLWSYIFGSKQ